MGQDQHLDGTASGAKRYVVAVSDIHLGTDGPTVWYQRDVHERYLAHLLDWVVAEADSVRELVLLGDVVDFWTYPCEELPPTFSQIAAAHPAIFGPDGKLAAALDALDGAVTYVPGNHDMGITAAEVATITSPGGHQVRLVSDTPYHPLGPDTRLALTHGHDFTLFNAPHRRNPWAPLPVGYFVTRVVSSGWARRLEPGRTVADLAGQGAPNGIELGSLGKLAVGLSAWSLTASLLDFVCGATGVGPEQDFLMPDGSLVSLQQVRAAYANCWTEWVVDHGGGLVGTSSAVRAALADLDGSYLGWFAQQLDLAAETELVVMGHTHVPISGLDHSPIRYVNTGFDCPSTPDMAAATNPQRTTLAVIDTVELDAEVWEVADGPEGLACRATTAARAQVSPRTGMDFSCYVEVDNTLGPRPLDLVAHTAEYGYFPAPPPATIPAGAVGRFWIQDLVGPSGSTGTATYTDGTTELALRFGCPTLAGNLASGTEHFATRTADGPWKQDTVDRRGRPLFVRYVV